MFVKIATKWEKKDYQVFSTGVWKKLVNHLDKHQAFNLYKAVRVFDPRQLPSVIHEISETLPTPFSLPDFWSSVMDRFPLLAAIASEMIWMPVTSVEAERSFSNYKHILIIGGSPSHKKIPNVWWCCTITVIWKDDSVDFLSISHKYDYFWTFNYYQFKNEKQKQKNATKIHQNGKYHKIGDWNGILSFMKRKMMNFETERDRV